MKIILLLILSSCSLHFGGPRGPDSAKGKHYYIKDQSAEWILKSDKRSDYVFENKNDGRIMLSNSFCDEFTNESLERLAQKTVRNIVKFKSTYADYKLFNKREAFELHGQGLIKGKQMSVQVLNTRRNNCYFDFISIYPVEQSEESLIDFDNFLNSVQFN